MTDPRWSWGCSSSQPFEVWGQRAWGTLGNHLRVCSWCRNQSSDCPLAFPVWLNAIKPSLFNELGCSVPREGEGDALALGEQEELQGDTAEALPRS